MENITSINWRHITRTIQKERCILFLGPGLFRSESGESLSQRLAQHLEVPDNPDIQSFYETDGLFLFRGKPQKTRSYFEIERFYEQSFPEAEELLRKIMRIPFHLIFSITPDRKYQDLAEQEGYPSKFDFYWKKGGKNSTLGVPSQQNPTYYNLFGAVEQQESLVLTHNDIFDYFESIFKENDLPANLKSSLQQASNLIFLGFDFDKWYMQLLLRILNLHDGDAAFLRYAASQQTKPGMRTFCHEQFKIEFMPSNTKEFVEELYQACEEEGLLREPKDQEGSKIDQLRKLMAKDKLKQVLEGLEALLEGAGKPAEDLLDDVLLLSNRHSRFERKQREGILDSRDEEVQAAKIRKSIIELLKEAEAYD